MLQILWNFLFSGEFFREAFAKTGGFQLNVLLEQSKIHGIFGGRAAH